MRWKLKANLDRFGGKGVEVKQRDIPFIANPYENADCNEINHAYIASRTSVKNNNFGVLPKIRLIEVDNYQGIIKITADYSSKIQWLNGGEVVQTKYSTVCGRFATEFKVEKIPFKYVMFKLIGDHGHIVSEPFRLSKIS